ncbi:MAG: baseplate J/gp47 family protein, partial [Saprospiraceae bacterium]|nr:baseplate J/gp47 family protein [Saprospiraceae bacterium]
MPPFPDEGTLYIGLKNVLPGGTLSLLFQLAEATADPEIGDAPLEWAYLIDNEWQELRKQFEVLDDQTAGLIASGIVRLSIPFNISSTGTTILPNTLNWIKVSAKQKTAAVSDTIAVYAQAVKTTFLPKPDNDTSRLNDPLKPKNISKLEVADAAVKKIEQPYESFGGIPAEAPSEFYRRVGERLRHKGRAVTLYDYERMVLEAFPEIFKVKCITHTLARNARNDENDYYLAPGHVALAILPDMKRFSFAAKLEPKASSALLRRIEDFLQKRSTPFVRIKAVNPLFEKIKIKTDVVFRAGKDQKYYESKLKEDLLRFLTPWAFGEQERLSFGGKMYRSSILHFVEGLDYVDYVYNFQLLDSESVDQQFIEAKSERSILASGEHSVTAHDAGKIP